MNRMKLARMIHILNRKNQSQQLNQARSLYEQVIIADKISNKRMYKAYFYYALLLSELKEYKLAEYYYELVLAKKKNDEFPQLDVVRYYYTKLIVVQYKLKYFKNSKYIYQAQTQGHAGKSMLFAITNGEKCVTLGSKKNENNSYMCYNKINGTVETKCYDRHKQ